MDQLATCRCATNAVVSEHGDTFEYHLPRCRQSVCRAELHEGSLSVTEGGMPPSGDGGNLPYIHYVLGVPRSPPPPLSLFVTKT
eukprot:2573837-Amphidinium_carterae.1